MPINKEVNVQLIFPHDKERLIGIQIENGGLDLFKLTEIAFFALDSGRKLIITDKSGTSYIYSPDALRNRLNNQDRHDWRGNVIEEMKHGSVITLADPLWQPQFIMSIPEKETTITIEIDPETGIMNGAEISPQSFSQAALKQILRSQIYAERPKDMFIQGMYTTSFWSSDVLLGIRRNYKGKERLKKIKSMAREMKRADKIIFQEPDYT